MAQEMLFEFDSCCANGALSFKNWTKDDTNVEDVRAPLRQTPATRTAYMSSVALGNSAETALQQEVRCLLEQLEPQSPYPQVRHDATGASAWLGTHSQVSSNLSRLCSLLKQRGRDAWTCQPVFSGGLSCGRRSTGGGGNCAAGPGRPCFFCSRMPYAVVLDVQVPEAAAAVPLASATHADVAAAGGGDAGGDAGVGFIPGEVVVVEPSLREIFRAAPATPEYGALVDALPQVWVGSREALLELADKVCDAMVINFRIQGLDVPPWRRRPAVLARWQSVPQLRQLPMQRPACRPPHGDDHHHHPYHRCPNCVAPDHQLSVPRSRSEPAPQSGREAAAAAEGKGKKLELVMKDRQGKAELPTQVAPLPVSNDELNPCVPTQPHLNPNPFSLQPKTAAAEVASAAVEVDGMKEGCSNGSGGCGGRLLTTAAVAASGLEGLTPAALPLTASRPSPLSTALKDAAAATQISGGGDGSDGSGGAAWRRCSPRPAGDKCSCSAVSDERVTTIGGGDVAAIGTPATEQPSSCGVTATVSVTTNAGMGGIVAQRSAPAVVVYGFHLPAPAHAG